MALALEHDGYTNINYTWGEQDSAQDISITSEYPMPHWWQTMKHEQSMIGSMSTDNLWQIDNVLTLEQCAQWIKASEELGYSSPETITPIGQTLLNTNIPIIWPSSETIRTNKRLIWQVPVDICNGIYAQIKGFIPDRVSIADVEYTPVALNRRFRFFKTSENEDFKSHIDAACCRINPQTGKYERSFLSVVIYLNNSFKGGELTTEHGLTIIPKTGSAVIFWHDGHPDAVRHMAKPVTHGTKYILRSDIYFDQI